MFVHFGGGGGAQPRFTHTSHLFVTEESIRVTTFVPCIAFHDCVFVDTLPRLEGDNFDMLLWLVCTCACASAHSRVTAALRLTSRTPLSLSHHCRAHLLRVAVRDVGARESVVMGALIPRLAQYFASGTHGRRGLAVATLLCAYVMDSYAHSRRCRCGEKVRKLLHLM